MLSLRSTPPASPRLRLLFPEIQVVLDRRLGRLRCGIFRFRRGRLGVPDKVLDHEKQCDTYRNASQGKPRQTAKTPGSSLGLPNFGVTKRLYSQPAGGTMMDAIPRDCVGCGATNTSTPFPSGGGSCRDVVLGSWPRYAFLSSVPVQPRLKMVEAVVAEVRGVGFISTGIPTPTVTATCTLPGTSFRSRLLLLRQFKPLLLLQSNLL